jgi:hypothetical protein
MTTPKHPYTNPLPYTTTTWRECVIWCAMSGGVRPVNASVMGALAVHKSFKRLVHNQWVYTITHIPTGKAIGHAHKSVAMKEAERLTALGDWNTRSPARLKALREAM